MEGGWDRRFKLVGDPVLSLCNNAHECCESSDFRYVRSDDGGTAYLVICIVPCPVPLLARSSSSHPLPFCLVGGIPGRLSIFYFFSWVFIICFPQRI